MKKIQTFELVTLKLKFWVFCSCMLRLLEKMSLNFIQCFSVHGATVHPSTFRLIEWSYNFRDDHPLVFRRVESIFGVRSCKL